MAGCCEHGDEPSGLIECGEFLVQLNDCQLHNNDCTVGSATTNESQQRTQLQTKSVILLHVPAAIINIQGGAKR